MRLEWRIHRKGSSQGHYVMAPTLSAAIILVSDNTGYPRSELDGVLWKIDGRMTPEAQRLAGM